MYKNTNQSSFSIKNNNISHSNYNFFVGGHDYILTGEINGDCMYHDFYMPGTYGNISGKNGWYYNAKKLTNSKIQKNPKKKITNLDF